MRKEFLTAVKSLIETSPEFIHCTVNVYIEPSISSVVFFINADDYHHIFKASFGLFETNLCAEGLSMIIVDEVIKWRDKYEETIR